MGCTSQEGVQYEVWHLRAFAAAGLSLWMRECLRPTRVGGETKLEIADDSKLVRGLHLPAPEKHGSQWK